MTLLEKHFQVAVDIVQRLTRPYGSRSRPGYLHLSSDQKLKFYSLFKQATVGNVNTDRPQGLSILAPRDRKEWDSWKELEGMSADEAKQNYIEAVVEIVHNTGGQVPADISECLSNLSL